MNHKLDNDRQVFFYEQEFYVLSNFSAFALEWAHSTFYTSEHAYHSEKFKWPGDKPSDDGYYDRCRIWMAIYTARSAHDAFKIAEANIKLVRPDWKAVRVGIMREILRDKVRQHEYVRRKLLQTGDRELIEDSWRDSFWGWGPDKNGENMLGKLWMNIRDECRQDGEVR